MHVMENSPDSIQSQGGKARAEKLTAERKTQIASTAALARWGAEATHKGNFQREFGIDVDCYVLNDANKTAVISLSGLEKSLGLSRRGNALRDFLGSKSMEPYAATELRDKIAQPFKFQWGVGGTEQPPSIIHGYDVTLLIDICRMIVLAEAEGKLGGARYQRIIEQAHVILGASAKAGIKGLVYALAGYNPTAEEVIKAFKTYVREEAKKYEKEFPPELYAEWYRLYNIPVIEGRGRPWHFKQLTVNHVYYPLAKSNGRILELIRASKASGGDRRNKLLQFLSETGTRALRFHLGRLVEMAEDSKSQAEYEAKIRKRFGGEDQQEFELTIPDPPVA